MIYTLTRDDIPSLSAWIKKSDKSKLVGFFGRGGRIRTYECNSQSVVSYRLTTPLYKNKMGWIIGFEPTTSRATTWRSNQLSYIHHLLARLKGLEPLTYCLEGSCSIQLSYKRIFINLVKLERVMGIEPTRPAWKAGILPLNYTRIAVQR